ncbi:unnamed protein product [Protopolystoma xenopodis]|uniref:Peptidase S8/S53 domain-containing protein n=1 Tax=Protopolystoma xenopodis TaxID=117903 RepID=A0A3S5BB91_9PLAT|nr:unnamed protein product [Protopolystoma xenopodis]
MTPTLQPKQGTSAHVNEHVLKNNSGGQTGIDMNVRDVWARGYAGQNVVVTVLDDGLETDHPDLAANYVCAPTHFLPESVPANVHV